MSSAPNQLPRSSKSASSSHSQTEAQADSALEPSSPAEPMIDQTANSVLMTPPTRMTSSDSTESERETSPTTTSPSPEPVASPVASPVAPSSGSSAPDPDPADAPAPQPPAAKVVGPRNQPIPPASEPMQYRAIGLVRGKYMPSEEQFTRGLILTDDEVQIDAVLLGRVMSLVKKHIDLEESHLWVVYPRTRDKELDLHMQIVGVWEPDKLNRSISDNAEDAEDADDLEDDDTEDDTETEVEATETAVVEEASPEQPNDAQPETTLPSPDDLDDRYFSVRGEVVFQSEEEDRLLIKIRRAPKPGSTQAKAFKVALKGKLEGKGLGYFWDFQVQREHNDLVVKEATQIGMVPPQKRKGGFSSGPRRGGPGRPGGGPRRGPGGPGGPSGPPRKRWQDREGGQSQGGPRPYRERTERSGGDRPQPPSTPRAPISKPVKRRPTSEES